jgi:hypothetical protein
VSVKSDSVMLSIWWEKQRVRRGLMAFSCGGLRKARGKNVMF